MKFLLKICIFAFCVNGLQSSKIVLKATSDADAGVCPELFTGLVPHPTFCPFYYLCDNGKPNLRECPTNLYFNPELEACDFSENVKDCVDGTRAPATSTTTSSTVFTTTTTRTTSTEETPEPEITVTVPVTGTGPTTMAPTTTTTTRGSTTTPPGGLICPPDVPAVFMSYPGDCSKFYLCQHGIVIEVKNCPTDLWFRYSIQSCRTPWGSDCAE